MSEERLSNDELKMAIDTAWLFTRQSSGEALNAAHAHFKRLLDAQAKRAEIKEPIK